MSDEKFTLVRSPATRPHEPSGVETKLSKAAPKVLTLHLKGTPRGRKKAKGGRGKAKGKVKLPTLPPEILITDVFPLVRRFQNASQANSVSVTRTSLCSSLGVMTIVANTTNEMFIQCFKLQSITIWPGVSTQGSAPVQCNIDAYMAGTAEQALVRETIKNQVMPGGVTLERPVRFTPKRGTYLCEWQNAAADGSDQLLIISAPAYSVLDLHVVACHVSGVTSAPGPVPTTSTTPVGQVGYMPIDANNKFIVQGLQSLLH